MAVPPKTVKLLKTLNKISTVGTILLITMVIILISILVYFKIDSDKVNADIKSLKISITELESSEQKLILAKDRLDKIAIIKSLPSVREDIINFKNINSLISTASGSALLEATIDESKTQLSITSVDSNSLASILAPLSNLTYLKNMILTSLGFGQTSGFISDILIYR